MLAALKAAQSLTVWHNLFVGLQVGNLTLDYTSGLVPENMTDSDPGAPTYMPRSVYAISTKDGECSSLYLLISLSSLSPSKVLIHQHSQLPYFADAQLRTGVPFGMLSH